MEYHIIVNSVLGVFILLVGIGNEQFFLRTSAQSTTNSSSNSSSSTDLNNNNNNNNNNRPGVDSNKARKRNVIKLGYLTGSISPNVTGKYYSRPGALISGGLLFALEQINADSAVLPDHYLDFIMAETYGLESESIKQTALLLNQGIAAYLGHLPATADDYVLSGAAAFNKSQKFKTKRARNDSCFQTVLKSMPK
nr:hypothetical protein BaRGS_015062 [Batillaria attramentaria]